LRIIKTTTITLRHAGGRVEALTGTGDKDAYRLACPGTGLRTLAVVRDRRSTLPVDLLNTHVAKAHLADPEAKGPGKVSAWSDLGLEILPRPDKGLRVFQVLYRGKAVEKSTVQIYRPGDADTDKVPEFTSDKEGLITLDVPGAGRYGLLVEQEFAEKGTYDGKPFARRRYTSTLVVDVAEPKGK
jgi:hypothetical protein